MPITEEQLRRLGWEVTPGGARRIGAKKKKPAPGKPLEKRGENARGAGEFQGTRRLQLEFSLPTLPITRNERDRLHWAARRKERARWKSLIASVAGRAPRRKEKMVLCIYFSRPGRLQDPDNAQASAKDVIDALRSLGWIWDDSEKWLALTVIESPGEIGTSGETEVLIYTPPSAAELALLDPRL